jgi:GTP diphosphokinase / guanosine-3',5'-bis(diphosphate) 3'-diphosphatase
MIYIKIDNDVFYDDAVVLVRSFYPRTEVMALKADSKPEENDEIVGFVTRGRGISIHRTDCVNIINFPANERARLIEAEWEQGQTAGDTYEVEINIFANNRTGLIVDISRMFTEAEIDVKSMNCRLNKKEFATISVGFDIHGKEELNRIIDKLRKIDGVTDITRTAG